MHEIFSAMTEFFKSHGIWGLSLNSFIESFFLVPPPDIILSIMDLANPDKALLYALICTIASAFGGAVGYGIGYWGGRPVFNFMFKKNGKEKFEAVENMYNKYGYFAVFFSAFTPVPYKVFTIASGILNMNFIQFMTASFFGRGLRFFIVSLVLMFFGEGVKKYLEPIIIILTIAVIIFYVIVYKKRKSFIKPAVVTDQQEQNSKTPVSAEQ